MSIPLIVPSSYTELLEPDFNKVNQPRPVPNAHYSWVQPEQFKNTQIIHRSIDLAQQLNIKIENFALGNYDSFLLGSNDSITKSFAMNYGGHQFGHWAGQLGDGRAINIGQINNEQKSWQVQLKGSGPTPYSRRGDGYAVLRSSIREHLCSEAMHYLGVPTTRSLSLGLTGEKVYRDLLYDGNGDLEKGAIVCRVAPSFIRFGNFQIHAANGSTDLLKQLADYTIQQYFPEITAEGPAKYLQFFKQVTRSTLELMIHWQRVGFVHGVMNTDNMSILGLTIDYGPYGWLDNYDPNWTPNTTDNQHKRYRFGAQPEIGLWNLWQLANSLYELVNESEPLEAILNQYKKDYQVKNLQMMRDKLGWMTPKEGDQQAVNQLEQLLELHEIDMTLFYRELIKVTAHQSAQEAFETIAIAFYNPEQLSNYTKDQWEKWLQLYVERLVEESAFAKARIEKMQTTNPKYVLRNYMAQMVIEKAEQGSYDLLEEVYEMLRKPYDEQPSMEHWYRKRPDWARDKPGASQLSCSS